VLPAAAYLAYAWSPLSGRGYGALALAGVLVVEYSLVGLIMFAAMRLLFDAALRERAAELGLATMPAGPSRSWRVTLAALLIAALVYIVIERFRIATQNVDTKFSLSTGLGFAIGACIWVFDLFTLLVGTRIRRSEVLAGFVAALLFAMVIGLIHLQPDWVPFAVAGLVAFLVGVLVVAIKRWVKARREQLPESPWPLAIVPVELLIVLTLAVLVLPLLQATERHATNQFQKPVPYIGNEIENSQYRDLRTQLLQDMTPPARTTS
jgi:hypothetical protein